MDSTADERKEELSEPSESEQISRNENFTRYPETVNFEGVVYTSLKQVHISAFLIILVGGIVAFFDPLLGFPLLIGFLLLVMGVEAWMIRKSRKQLRLTLHLREDPVVATQGNYRVGAITNGAIDPDMDSPNELGFRPAPNRSMFTWTFDTIGDKEAATKRLLEYLPLDDLTPKTD